MAGWFAVAALCMNNACTLYDIGEAQGYAAKAPCEVALAARLSVLPINKTVEIGGEAVVACLPLGRRDKYTAEQVIEWLRGKRPGEKS